MSSACVTADCWPGGYCAPRCSSTTPCPSGSYCNASGYCLKACTSTTGQATCRSNYVCDRGFIASDRNLPTCVYRCISNADCPKNAAGTQARCDMGYCAGLPTYRCIGAGYAATPLCLNGAACKSNGYCP
jgi:hypothetical protein